jgi:hypothetical protein
MSPRLRSVAAFGLSLTIATALVILDSAVPVEAQTRLTQQDADRCQTKLGRISAFAAKPKPKAAAGSAAATQTTQLTDTELNAYIKFNLKNEVPAGVVDPTLTAMGEGKVRGAAVIDLDTVRKQKQRSWTDPLGYMTGKLPLTASGLLITQNGIGRFQLESAEISGITIPKSLLQELLSFYSKSTEKPSGISMDDPFELPASIKEIRVGKGEAMVVQ